MTKIIRLNVLFVFLLISSITAEAKTNLNVETFSSSYTVEEDIQRVRIYFTTPLGYVRHLLLAFTPDNSASDSYNYGYDAINRDNLPDDLSWMIGDTKFVIQGVGAFDDIKKYPLGMFLMHAGDIKIDLLELENFDSPIDIFIYDSLLETYTKINETSFTENMTSGEHLDRFYIAFKDESEDNAIAKNSLTTEEVDIEEDSLENMRINYLSNSDLLYVKANSETVLKSISLFDIQGRQIINTKTNASSEIRISLSNISTTYGIVYVETDKGITSKKILLH